MNEKRNLTIDDIARDLGVSKTTVSRAISGKGRIGAATRERVLAYIEKCNYRPSAAAKGLAESRTYNLALVLPRAFIKLDLPFIRRSMSAICQEASSRDYNILLCMADTDPESLTRILDNRKADGVILTRTMENDVLIDIITARDVPFATLGSLPSQYRGLATVEADNDQVGGCRAFTEALLQKRPEKTALLGGELRYIVNQSRLEGVKNAVKALDFPDFHMETNLSPTTCTEALDRLLSQGVRQFLCMDDDICIAALRHLEEQGLRIPEDVRLASLYDNDELRKHQPAISALQFDAGELGRSTCRELLNYLHGEPHDPQLKLGYQICLRSST